MNSLENMIGVLCKAILPIPEESYQGNPSSTIAVCTLSSLDLLKEMAKFRHVTTYFHRGKITFRK